MSLEVGLHGDDSFSMQGGTLAVEPRVSRWLPLLAQGKRRLDAKARPPASSSGETLPCTREQQCGGGEVPVKLCARLLTRDVSNKRRAGPYSIH